MFSVATTADGEGGAAVRLPVWWILLRISIHMFQFHMNVSMYLFDIPSSHLQTLHRGWWMRQDSIFASSPHVLQTTGLGSSASSHSSAVTEDLRTLVFNQIHCLLWPVWSTHHSAVLVMFKPRFTEWEASLFCSRFIEVLLKLRFFLRRSQTSGRTWKLLLLIEPRLWTMPEPLCRKPSNTNTHTQTYLLQTWMCVKKNSFFST